MATLGDLGDEAERFKGAVFPEDREAVHVSGALFNALFVELRPVPPNSIEFRRTPVEPYRGNESINRRIGTYLTWDHAASGYVFALRVHVNQRQFDVAISLRRPGVGWTMSADNGPPVGLDVETSDKAAATLSAHVAAKTRSSGA